MAVRLIDEKVVYTMNVKIPARKINQCAHCKKAHAEMASAHYPGMFFCSMSCLWKYDAIGKRAIHFPAQQRSVA